MATTILTNKVQSAVLHFTSSNASIVVSGNSTTTNVDSSSVCLASGSEVIGGVTIAQAFWGVAPASDGHVVVKRGSNIVAVFDSTGWHDYAGNGFSLNKDKAANLVVEFASSANAYLILEVQKVGSADTYLGS